MQKLDKQFPVSYTHLAVESVLGIRPEQPVESFLGGLPGRYRPAEMCIRDRAMAGYKEINYRAMRLLPRGGYLATCSCSHFATEELFRKMLRDACLLYTSRCV